MKTDPLAQLRTGAPLTTRQQMSLTLQLSWPAIMAQLATIIMQYIDAAMVGRLGATQSAAVGLVASTTWLFGGLSYAAAMGFNVLTAQRVGGGRLAEARNILKQALVLCLAFSVVMAALAAALSAPLPGMLRADRDIWQDASFWYIVCSYLPSSSTMWRPASCRPQAICVRPVSAWWSCAHWMSCSTPCLFSLPALSGSAR